MIIGITTTLNEADGFQRVNVEYINRVAATGAVPILLTPIAGGAEANREHARHVIELVDGLLITGGGDVHPRYYVPDPAKNRDALGLDDLAAMGCGSSSHCRSTGAKVPFCGHYVPDRTFEEAMDGTSAVETVESLDGRDVLSATGRPPIPCLDGLLAVCEDRDGFELELARLAHERSLPTLGICRGMQVMNVALGGSLYRDLYNCGVTEKQHRQNPPYYGISHKVTIAKGSLLESVVSASGDFE
ncbi:gamma-glutamyl-gamma-aminobutyrate hydrolase family protein, partial [Adlercreutzia sp.]